MTGDFMTKMSIDIIQYSIEIKKKNHADAIKSDGKIRINVIIFYRGLKNSQHLMFLINNFLIDSFSTHFLLIIPWAAED